MALDVGDVGAYRNIAAVFRAPLADVQPAPVIQLGLEGAGARNLTFARDLGAHYGFAPRFNDGFIRCAGRDRLVRQIVQRLEIGIAQHQPVLRIPHYEGFRNRFDGIAQPQIRLDGSLDQRLLLGNVDCNSNEMRTAVAGLLDQLATRAHPDPVTVGVPHPKRVVDERCLGLRELACQLVEVDVLGMD